MVTEIGGFINSAYNIGIALLCGGIVILIIGMILANFPIIGCVFGPIREVCNKWALQIAGLGLVIIIIVHWLKNMHI